MNAFSVLTWALLSGMVCHRVWRMVARDSLFDRWRDPVLRRPGFVADLIDCAWCLGFWLNVIVGLTLWLTGTMDAIPAVLVVLAGSTVTGVLARGD